MQSVVLLRLHLGGSESLTDDYSLIDSSTEHPTFYIALFGMPSDAQAVLHRKLIKLEAKGTDGTSTVFWAIAQNWMVWVKNKIPKVSRITW